MLLALLFVPALFAALVFFCNGGFARPGEPPLYRGWLPFVGAAVEFGRSPYRFVRERGEALGLFGVWLAGKRTVVVTDPQAYAQVLSNPRKLQLWPVAAEIVPNMFGPLGPNPGRDYQELHHQLTPLFPRFLQGDGLVAVTARVQELLAKRVGALGLTDEWQTVDLFDFCLDAVFAATVDALYHDGWSSPGLPGRFYEYDNAVPLLAGGLPKRLFPGADAARNELRSRMLDDARWDEGMMKARVGVAREHGTPDEVLASAQLGMMWASVANTIPTSFWALYHTLADPEAKAAVEQELRRAMEGAPVGEADGLPRFSAEDLKGMRAVSSCIDEALRLYVSPMLAREAMETLELQVRGRAYTVYKGSRVVVFPPQLHRDPEVYPDPDSFRFDRFLDPAAERFKGGKRVAKPLIPWGGGVSMCPGRFFARNEMQILFAYLLAACDFELLPGPPPEPDMRRVGLGALTPAGGGGVKARVRRRG